MTFEARTDDAGDATFEACEGALFSAHVLGLNGARPLIFSGQDGAENPGWSGPGDVTIRASRPAVWVYRVPQPRRLVIRGVVRDEAGRTMPDASCALCTGPSSWTGRSTSADGRYEIELDPEADGVLEIFRPGFVTHLVLLRDLPKAVGDTIDYDVTLARGAMLVGRVVDEAGKPVAGARVQAAVAKDDPWLPPAAPVPGTPPSGRARGGPPSAPLVVARGLGCGDRQRCRRHLRDGGRAGRTPRSRWVRRTRTSWAADP